MANTLYRGEIFLTPTELESFQERLEQLWKAAAEEGAAVDIPWKLMPLDAAVSRAQSLLQSDLIDMNVTLTPKRERSSNTHTRKNASRRTSSTEVAGHETIDEDIDSLFKEIMDEDFDDIENVIEPHHQAFQELDDSVDYDDTSPIYPLLHPDETLLPSMPSWVEKFHHVISSLCRTKSGSQFVTHIELESNSVPEGGESRSEPPKMTLQLVLEKLLKNNYGSATEAFTEVYAMLIAVFKFQNPGTRSWMYTHDACCRLDKLRRDSGLIDSEVATVGFGGKHPPAPINQAQQSVESLADARPISPEEKVQFQDALSALSPENHVELYIAFENTAVWRNVGNGEIELDDDATDPNVFRDMMRWANQANNNHVESDLQP
ncbi:ABC transporter, putative [Babesia ovis]|uniref:ABC transporter, putative n=1 Tax=Babesia ovis TaxID=5869 RepID=A0A9W5TAX3_BABOV|nr:ABC transporter, putative [Babesia ovis]